MSKIEKILSIILISLFLISISSCVSKKKFKESQTSLEQRILNQTEQRISQSIQNYSLSATEKLIRVIDEKYKSFKESSSTNENESTSISGTLPTSDKETSVTVGNTVIKNNGGNVSFDIKSSKQLTSQLETLNKEYNKRLEETLQSIKSVRNELNEMKESYLKMNEELKVFKEIKSKENNKKGLSFWVIKIAIVLALLFVAYKVYGRGVVENIKSFFTKR